MMTACAQKLVDDSRADEAGAAGDQNVHVASWSPSVMYAQSIDRACAARPCRGRAVTPAVDACGVLADPQPDAEQPAEVGEPAELEDLAGRRREPEARQ